jgi:hypothetical protein
VQLKAALHLVQVMAHACSSSKVNKSPQVAKQVMPYVKRSAIVTQDILAEIAR